MNGFLKNGLLVVGGVVLGSMVTQKAIVDTLHSKEIATLADFYDLAGVRALYEDCKFGWTSLRGAKIVCTRNGYAIELPRATPLK